MITTCFFCAAPTTKPETTIVETDLAYARWDDFPVSDGHVEVVPKRHVQSYFDLTRDEVLALHELAGQARAVIDAKYHPDAYNIGINDGETAGQTVMHCHMHLIPRYSGDVASPRGGVRNIIPGKGDY